MCHETQKSELTNVASTEMTKHRTEPHENLTKQKLENREQVSLSLSLFLEKRGNVSVAKPITTKVLTSQPIHGLVHVVSGSFEGLFAFHHGST